MIPTEEIKGYLNKEGKLTGLPARRRKKIIALAWLADQLPEDLNCTEREFNVLLNTLHTFGDPATLRRELYDAYLIERDQNGAHYHMDPNRPTLEQLLEKLR